MTTYGIRFNRDWLGRAAIGQLLAFAVICNLGIILSSLNTASATIVSWVMAAICARLVVMTAGRDYPGGEWYAAACVTALACMTALGTGSAIYVSQHAPGMEHARLDILPSWMMCVIALLWASEDWLKVVTAFAGLSLALTVPCYIMTACPGLPGMAAMPVPLLALIWPERAVRTVLELFMPAARLRISGKK